MIDTTPTNSATNSLEDKIDILTERIVASQYGFNSELTKLLKQGYQILYPTQAQIQTKKSLGYMLLARHAGVFCNVPVYDVAIYNPKRDEKVLELRKPEEKVMKALDSMKILIEKTYKQDAN